MSHPGHSSMVSRWLGAACLALLAVSLRSQEPAAAPAAPPPAPADVPAEPVVRAPAITAPPAVRRSPLGVLRSGPGAVRPVRTQPPGAAATAPVIAAPAATAPATETSASGTNGANGESADDGEAIAPELKFDGSSSDIVLLAYARETKRTLLMAPDVPKVNITLRSQTALTRREYLQAIQTALNMNGIALLPVGDKFLKVVTAAAYRPSAPQTLFEEPANGQHEELGEMVSQMVQLKYITIDEVKGVLDGFKRPQGLILVFERTNSILITDAAENVNRMLEIIHFLDQPHNAREEVNVRPIKYAKAATIKQRLDEIVAESLKAQQAAKESPQAKSAGSPGIVRAAAPMVPGVLRSPSMAPAAASPANQAVVEALMDEAERGVIRGKVQILADERTNIMIIITPPENMTFFDRIISVLDIETTPDVGVEVMRLEYADAEEVAKMLNDLIGNAKADQPKSTVSGAASENKAAAGEAPKSENLASFAERMRSAASTTAPAAGEAAKSKVGELSKDNIKILSNKRTNAVIVMASKSDTAAIKEIIKDMDIMLSQVLIETVVLDVSLTKELSTGISWLQTQMHTVGNSGVSWVGSGGAGGGTATHPISSPALGSATSLTNAFTGLQYFFTMPNIDVNAVIQAASSDDRTKVLTSPVLLTQDNKEATIESKKTVYLTKGSTPVTTGTLSGSSTTYYQPNVDAKDIGITVKVTPRINQKGMVVLHVDETFEGQTGSQSVPTTAADGSQIAQDWPVISTRKLTADIAMKSGETVILGGLVTTSKAKNTTKVPLLGDIPFIGRYLFGSTDDKDERTELLVFLTPYVLDTAESMDAEARRRKEHANAEGLWTKGWSNSKLADESIAQKIKRQMAEHAAAALAARTNQPPMVIRSSGVMCP